MATKRFYRLLQGFCKLTSSMRRRWLLQVFSLLANVDKWLRCGFHKLGYQIGLTPGYFIIIPILLTALAATGFQRIKFEADPEYLFSPINGEAKTERRILEHLFPMNYSDFDAGRISRHGRFGRLIVQPIDKGNILRKSVFDEILVLDQVVRSISVVDPDPDTKMNDPVDISYEDLCARRQGECHGNPILAPGKYASEIENGTIVLTYPIWFDPATFQRVVFPFFAGGIRLNDDHSIAHIEVLALNYFLKNENEEDRRRYKAVSQ